MRTAINRAQEARLIQPIMLAIIVLVLAFFVWGCSILGSPGEVLVERKYVTPGAPVIETMRDVKGPDGEPTGDTYVITDEANVMPGAPTVPLDETPGSPLESPGVWNAITGMLGGTPLSPFAPLAGWLALKLFAKRPRANLASAMRSLGHGKVKDAIYDLAAAEGINHTELTPTTK